MANEAQNQDALYARLVADLSALESPSTDRLANIESVLSALVRIQLGWWTSPPPTPTAVPDPSTASPARNVVLLNPLQSASAVATNNAANVFTAVSDPNLRQMVDLRGMTKVRVMGRFGGTTATATKVRVQYHTGGNPAVASADAGWATLCDTAGSHTAGAWFYSGELSVPAGAQINNCQVRAGIFSGDGAADPTLTACILNFYP